MYVTPSEYSNMRALLIYASTRKRGFPAIAIMSAEYFPFVSCVFFVRLLPKCLKNHSSNSEIGFANICKYGCSARY